MPHFISIQNLQDAGLDIYARLSEVQLLRYREPKPGIFIAESPIVVERGPVNTLGLTVAFYLVPASDDIVFLHLALEPLVNFILSLGALHNTQPVPAGPLGVLGSDDFQLVAVLNHIFNGHQLAVDPGSHHLIAHGAVYTICKVNGCMH